VPITRIDEPLARPVDLGRACGVVALVGGYLASRHRDQAGTWMRMPAGRTAWLEGVPYDIDVRIPLRLNLDLMRGKLWVFTLILPKRPMATCVEASPDCGVASAGTTISAATTTSALTVAIAAVAARTRVRWRFNVPSVPVVISQGLDGRPRRMPSPHPGRMPLTLDSSLPRPLAGYRPSSLNVTRDRNVTSA
jgi:hypothetical protein